MVTKPELDSVLKDVNRVFGVLEERISELTKRIEKLEENNKTSKTTTSKPALKNT